MSLSPQQNAAQNRSAAAVIEARTCKSRYDFQGAIQVLQRAHKLEPTNDKIAFELGVACAQAYDFTSAQEYFEKTLQLAASKVDALNAIGEAWLDLMHFEAAKNCFEEILREGQLPVFTAIRLARVYLRFRRNDDALELLERALQHNQGNAGLLFMRAKALRPAGDDDEAERLLRALVTMTDIAPEVRAWAWYEWASILDHHGQYDEAMSAFLEAKAILRLTAGPALKVLHRKQMQLKEMVEKIRENPMPRWRKSAVTDLQPPRRLALLCGYARSGTTLLEYVLDAHPQVVSADETTVFHNVAYSPLASRSAPNSSLLSVLDWMPPRELRQIRNNYFRAMTSFVGHTQKSRGVMLGNGTDDAFGGRLLVDKNPSYVFDLPTMLRVFPELKVLVALRDPRDVCLSCFMQPAPMIGDMSAWLTLEGTIQHYAHVMRLWLAWKPWLEDAAVEVRYEDMVDNLAGTTRRTLEGLELPWDDRVLKFNEHLRDKIVRSPTFVEVNKPVYKTAVARWRNYQKYFEPHLSTVTPFLSAFGYE